MYRPETSGFRATTVPVRDALTSGARELLLILLGITGLVLLIACANVANLTLARMLGRDRELAMRAALGAGRGRLVRQLLTESTLLATVGGAIGIGFAWITIDMLTTFVGRFTSRTGEIGLDPMVLVFTLGVSILTGVLFGTLPALGSRVDLVAALKQGGGQAGDAGSRKRIQGALIVAQVAVSVMLLVGAGLLLASFFRLQRVETGYRSDGVLSAADLRQLLPLSRPSSNSATLYLPVLERIQSQAGVSAAAITNAVPLGGGAPGTTRFDIEGRSSTIRNAGPTADVRVATPQYFATIGVPVVSGRVFNDLDSEESLRGRRDQQGDDEVLGRHGSDRQQDRAARAAAARNARRRGRSGSRSSASSATSGSSAWRRRRVAQMYVPLTQSPFGVAGQILVRTAGDPTSFANVLRSTVHAVDPNQPVENVQTLDDLRSEALAAPRLTATLLGVFAALALLVTLAGIGGVIATSVQQRTKEFGLRMALGARRDSVLMMVVRQGLTLVVIGLAIGVVGALAAGRVLSAYLYQTAPRDPLIFAGVAALFILSGMSRA